jgi:hypothetical protein
MKKYIKNLNNSKKLVVLKKTIFLAKKKFKCQSQTSWLGNNVGSHGTKCSL